MTMQQFDHYLRFGFLALMSALLLLVMAARMAGFEIVSGNGDENVKVEMQKSQLS